MRVDAVNQSVYRAKVQSNNVTRPNYQQSRSFGPNVVSMSDYLNRPISFLGTPKNKEQVIFIGAEVAPFSKAGGVGTVMKDYAQALKPENEVVVSPYYGAEVDDVGHISPAIDKDGDYVLPKKGTKLELIAEKTMQWGPYERSDIKLFREKDTNSKFGKKVHYFVYNDQTAHFKEPYEKGFTYSTNGNNSVSNEPWRWTGDAYAQFSKAAVELLPELLKDKGKDFKPATIVCSDSQTAYVQHYMAKKSLDDSDDNIYWGIKPTYVGHNMGPGYCGETSKQNMFVNLGATPDQIKMIEDDKMYKDGLLGDDYFKPFVEETLDETGSASAVMIPFHYTKKDTANGEGYAKAFSVVAEEYANSLAENPQAAHNIYNNIRQLKSEGTFTGIMNALNDPSVDATKPLPNELYAVDVTDFNGKVYKAFQTYPENATYQQMRDVKNANKLNLLERLSAKNTSIVSGNPKAKAKINPELADLKGVQPFDVIRKDLIQKVKDGKGDEVPVFVSWGRADSQKGHDITLKAFEKFAKTEEGKNAILILGAGLDYQKNGEEARNITDKMSEMLKDPDLQGRIVHIDGWAPAYALASAADAAIFASRFEPCGLTDLEAMKYYCTPIVTNTQGLKQKNFDPRNPEEEAKATSYKTQHEFNLLASQVNPIIECYADENKTNIAEIKKEFPIFVSKDSSGMETFDETVFKKFGDKYKEFRDNKKKELLKQYESEGEFPKGWDDWDKLSQNYDFKFKGFARELKDDILAYEMADAIKACATASESEKQNIYSNLKNVKTSWDENGVLHPDGRSSLQLYKDLHMSPDYSQPTEEDIITISDENIEKTQTERQKTDISKRVNSYLGGALTGLATSLFFKTGEAEYKPDFKPMEDKIKRLESQLSGLKKTHKKELIIAGSICAVAGGFLTALVSGAIMKRQNETSFENVNVFKTIPEDTTKNEELAEKKQADEPLVLTIDNFKNSLSLNA